MEMMSREDWRHIVGPHETDDDIKIRPGVDGKSLIVGFSGARMKQVASACLYDQEYGFTWEDVEMLGRVSDLAEREGYEGWARHMRLLADRLGALLPPKDLVVAANLPGTPIDY